MARGQAKPKRPGAFGDARDASSNVPGTKQDSGMEPTPYKDRPGPRAAATERQRRQRPQDAERDASASETADHPTSAGSRK